MTKGTEHTSLEAGPDTLIFPFLVQRVTGPNWSEVGEEGNNSMGRGEGGLGCCPWVFARALVEDIISGWSMDGCVHVRVHLMETSKCFHVPEPCSPCCASLPAVCVGAAGSWLFLLAK